MSPLETKLRTLVAALDDSALETLASKGLLRRAQKDLERGVKVEVRREDAGAMHFAVEQFEVLFPEAGPAKAKCSCPAPGVCQHILVAVLFLKRSKLPASEKIEEPGAAGAAEQELLRLTREQLETWAGKASFRGALELVSQYDPEIASEQGIVVRFPAINARCIYSPGAGLDGVIVSGNTKDTRRIVVAGIVAFQRLKGVPWEIAAQMAAPPEESTGAPRSRAEVLEVTNEILVEMLENGLARVSAAKQERLATLAVSATGVNLPRLSLLLRGLSDECALIAARDARSDLGRMLNRMANTHALCVALQQGGSAPRADLVGWHRTHYDEIGRLDLAGAAAWPWRTASGYAGLTLLFWDTAAKAWNSWTEARPLTQQRDFHPVARYTQPGPWEGADSPRQLARSCVRLMHARRNPFGRLSGSSKSRALVTGPVKLQAEGVPVVVDWTSLVQPLESQVAVGLSESNPLDSIFVLKPSLWGPRKYDAVAQIFSWLLLDAQQRALLLEIAFDPFTEPAIKYLENVAEGALEQAMIVGRIQRTPRGLSLHPFSIHRSNGEITHLSLDTASASATAKPAIGRAQDEDADDIEEENETEIVSGSFVGRSLDELDDVLLSMAELGIRGLNPSRVQKLEQIIPRIERLNLQVLAAGLKNIVKQPGAAGVLRGCYLSHLHRAAMPLAG